MLPEIVTLPSPLVSAVPSYGLLRSSEVMEMSAFSISIVPCVTFTLNCPETSSPSSSVTTQFPITSIGPLSLTLLIVLVEVNPDT